MFYSPHQNCDPDTHLILPLVHLDHIVIGRRCVSPHRRSVIIALIIVGLSVCAQMADVINQDLTGETVVAGCVVFLQYSEKGGVIEINVGEILKRCTWIDVTAN